MSSEPPYGERQAVRDFLLSVVGISVLVLAVLFSNAFMEIMVVGICALTLGAVVFGATAWLTRRPLCAFLPKKGPIVLSVSAGLAAILWIVVPHCWATVRLADLRAKFGYACEHCPHTQYSVDDDEQSVTALDYGGALDGILSERDRRLRHWGFDMPIGKWHTGSGGTDSYGLYLWVGR